MLSSIIYLYVLLIFVTRIIHGQSLCSCNQPDLDFANGVNLLYYKCNSEIPATIAYPITVPQTLLKVLDDNKRTIFYVYGYLQFPEDKNVQLMMKALCHGRTDNVVLLEWSKYSNGTYASVFRNAEKIGSLFAQSVQLLVESGLDVSKIYIVAHSLGAHIAGFVGKCNTFKIPRITALDPANPIFYLPGCYLTRNDAMWVDVIHTDIGGYGTPTSMGTADYYVNGGTRPQPGCKFFVLPLLSDNDLCSHQKSVVLYAKLKRHPMKFIAKECSSFFHYILNDCYKIWKIDIGYAAVNISGSFYFPINNI